MDRDDLSRLVHTIAREMKERSAVHEAADNVANCVELSPIRTLQYTDMEYQEVERLLEVSLTRLESLLPENCSIRLSSKDVAAITAIRTQLTVRDRSAFEQLGKVEESELLTRVRTLLDRFDSRLVEEP
jgi:hypothetical protein